MSGNPSGFESRVAAIHLSAAGFHSKARAVVSWIGVTMYLTMEAVQSTLRELLALARGSRVVLTYNLPLSALEGLSLETSGPLRAMTAQMGEPFISFFLPNEMEQLMLDLGYADVVHFGPQEMVRTYFSGRPDVRLGGAQRLLVARV